ncbi:MAG TPA: serine/threonine-protein kinase [Armatimonadota bacterium]|nr:serine/threonine-protein kinase [Armatimonadota bacterium]
MINSVLNNRYRLEAELGRGGMGIVYRAIDLQLQRAVAVKVLPAQLTRDPKFVERFRTEVLHTAQLDHPNIVRVFDVGEDAGTLYFVMQLVEGTTLRAELQRKGRYTFDEALPILRQVAEALDYSHEQGIVHRDIKPENILLDGKGMTRVVDFGIARPVDATRATMGLVGTPEYLSPEQIKGEAVDGRTDQYALGIVTYEMLSGTPPFTGDQTHPMAILNMHVNSPVPDISIRSALPTSTVASILIVLAKKPQNRYANCKLFVLSIKPLREHRFKKKYSIITLSLLLSSVLISCILWQCFVGNNRFNTQYNNTMPAIKKSGKHPIIYFVEGRDYYCIGIVDNGAWTTPKDIYRVLSEPYIYRFFSYSRYIGDGTITADKHSFEVKEIDPKFTKLHPNIAIGNCNWDIIQDKLLTFIPPQNVLSAYNNAIHSFLIDQKRQDYDYKIESVYRGYLNNENEIPVYIIKCHYWQAGSSPDGGNNDFGFVAMSDPQLLAPLGYDSLSDEILSRGTDIEDDIQLVDLDGDRQREILVRYYAACETDGTRIYDFDDRTDRWRMVTECTRGYE